MKRTIFCIGLPLLLLLVSCEPYLNMEPLKIESWNPSARTVENISDITISIKFSTDVDKTKAEQGFSLKTDGVLVPGYFSWSGKDKLNYTPYLPLNEDKIYTISMETTVEDTFGNSLNKPFLFSFSTKEDWGRPALIDLDPADNSFIDDPYYPINLTFSEPMNVSSFLENFSLSPSVEGSITWNQPGDGTMVFTFTPREPLNYQTRYTITIPRDICDESYNLLSADITRHFTVGSDVTPPVISAVTGSNGLALTPDDPENGSVELNTGWEKTNTMTIQFNEPVDAATLKRAISFFPEADFGLDYTEGFHTDFVLTHESVWTIDETYIMTIGNTVKDGMDNHMENQALYYFRVDGPGSEYLTPVAITFNKDIDDASTVILFTEATGADNINIEEPGQGFLDVYFRKAPSANAILQHSLLTTYSFGVTNSCAAFVVQSIKTGAAITGEAPMVIPGLDMSDIIVVRYYLLITDSVDNLGFVTFSLRTGIEDDLRNPMKQGFEWKFIEVIE